LIELDAIFTAGAAVPHDGFLDGLDLKRSDHPLGSFLAVDEAGRTSNDRVWAVGNVVNPAANVPASMGAGSMAGAAVNAALVTEEFDQAMDRASQGPGHDGDVRSPAEHWEEQYATSSRRWSGRVNATMADVVGSLPVGHALDLGSGEGGDAVWLAEHGWRVTAVDISPTAVARGAAGAAERNVADNITWICHDLSTWSTTETFDLVTASFLHSTVELPRTAILRHAAGRIRPGGHLLVLSHVFESEEDIPPWASRHKGDDHKDPRHGLLAPADELAELGLNAEEWETVLQEIRPRTATGPDGEQQATVKDGVVLVRRLTHS
jgi:2-polyprenyl-3-methyl-5-hydroxy-6-metoxy-1,4-benzoquinol methylase